MNDEEEISLVQSSRKTTKTYDERRDEAKNNFFTATIMLFKGTVGLGVLVNQYYLGKTGLILGSFCTVLVIGLISYGIRLSLDLANQIESASNGKTSFKTLDSMIGHVLGKKWKIVTKVMSFGLNQVACLVNLASFARFLKTRTLLSLHSGILTNIQFLKMIAVGCFCLVTILIVEPENYKYTSIAAFLILLTGLIIMMDENIGIILSNGISEFNLFNPVYLASIASSQLYSFESIGIIFGIRSTLKEPKQMKGILTLTFSVICVFSLVFASSFLLVS